MQRVQRAAVLVALVMAVGSTAALAAPRGCGGAGCGSAGWGMKGEYQRMYNPATVESLRGEVQSIGRMTPRKGMGAGIHLQLKTEQETVSVHLGPAWYLDRQDTRIEKGDVLEIKGSKITMSGKPVIIAQEVKKGDAVLRLRDDNGVPVWAGWRR
ncbi:DNA-binding protein [Geomonas paludis]|uniref:DNA-binding protein n=1 Tax=Geomonas paludis TaxID=2740185 RepID=A0A6V8MS13_9BACT|nr:DNA-binding protein [Geomonas paludis]UPU35546.1 DNA-binding protein [Geomonas paludis]GFO62880.1 hypothetical protein GMPD_07990 [Geomonas paludis]